MKSQDDKFSQFDKLQDELNAKVKHQKIHKVSGKSVFKLQEIIKQKSDDQKKS